MKHLIVILCFAALAQSAFTQTAMEKAEKRIADLVAPGSATPTLAKPIEWQAGRAVVEIAVPMKPYAGAPARLPQAPIKDVKPRGVPEGQPLASHRDGTQVPKAVELPTAPLVRLPAVDLHAPLAIPILAIPQKDRASLGDPAFEASLDAAMKRFTPTRDRPLPFTPYNLPDPFEHLRYGQLRNPPPESAMPPVIPLQKPTK